MTNHHQKKSTGGTVRLADGEILGARSPSQPTTARCLHIHFHGDHFLECPLCTFHFHSPGTAHDRRAQLKMLNCLVDGCTFKRTLGECLKSILNFKMSRTVSNCIQESSRGCTSPDGTFFGTKCVCDLMILMVIPHHPQPFQSHPGRVTSRVLPFDAPVLAAVSAESVVAAFGPCPASSRLAAASGFVHNLWRLAAPQLVAILIGNMIMNVNEQWDLTGAPVTSTLRDSNTYKTVKKTPRRIHIQFHSIPFCWHGHLPKICQAAKLPLYSVPKQLPLRTAALRHYCVRCPPHDAGGWEGSVRKRTWMPKTRGTD